MKTKEVIKEMFSKMKSNWYMPVIEHQVYSEQEQVIGRWTDGKPLYRNFIALTTEAAITANTWNNVASVSDLNIEALVKCSGYYYNFTLVSVFDYSRIEGDILKVFAQTGNRISHIIIEYTKTTDTPAAQPKVPFEPLVEYSTEEKMIGYFGEKSVYRKTLSGSATSSNSTYFPIGNVADVLPNLDKIFSAKIIISSPIAGYIYPDNGKIQIYNGVINVQQAVSSTSSEFDYVLTFEYTKTTD